jgi:hypothetical protein
VFSSHKRGNPRPSPPNNETRSQRVGATQDEIPSELEETPRATKSISAAACFKFLANFIQISRKFERFKLLPSTIIAVTTIVRHNNPSPA